MWIDEGVIISDTDPNRSYTTTEYKNKYATIKLIVSGDFIEKSAGAYYDIKKNVNTTTVINFANISSYNNGEGLYILPGTENDAYPIYYYRGSINNNNVIFGGFCWQMVRTTDTGGIKMIYNGEPTVTVDGNNTTYDCGTTRPFQNSVLEETYFGYSNYYYADDYEIVSTDGNGVTYRLKSKNNPLIRISMENATDVEANVPTIAANYPYTCRGTNESSTCTILYKIDNYASGVSANAYASTDISTIGHSVFNSQQYSASDIGYMSNTRYPDISLTPASNSIYGKNIEWDGTKYLVIEDTEHVASTNTTQDNDHHYTCGKVNNEIAETECSSVRYVYRQSSFDILLTNGETLDDALYKMTGNGSVETKQKNSSYVLNQNDTPIKQKIDTWFETNLTNVVDNTKTDYRQYLENTIYCNDRSYQTIGSGTLANSGWNPNGGSLNNYLYFGSRGRVYNSWYSTTNVPSLACPNETDRFSVSSTVAHLNYPVGLLTADEIVMAGASGNSYSQLTNKKYYLYTGGDYWTMTPSEFGASSFEFCVDDDGDLKSDYVVNGRGVRPVVSLKLGVEFETGGNGTPTNPYIVKYN